MRTSTTALLLVILCASSTLAQPEWAKRAAAKLKGKKAGAQQTQDQQQPEAPQTPPTTGPEGPQFGGFGRRPAGGQAQADQEGKTPFGGRIPIPPHKLKLFRKIAENVENKASPELIKRLNEKPEQDQGAAGDRPTFTEIVESPEGCVTPTKPEEDARQRLIENITSEIDRDTLAGLRNGQKPDEATKLKLLKLRLKRAAFKARAKCAVITKLTGSQFCCARDGVKARIGELIDALLKRLQKIRAKLEQKKEAAQAQGQTEKPKFLELIKKYKLRIALLQKETGVIIVRPDLGNKADLKAKLAQKFGALSGRANNGNAGTGPATPRRGPGGNRRMPQGGLKALINHAQTEQKKELAKKLIKRKISEAFLRCTKFLVEQQVGRICRACSSKAHFFTQNAFFAYGGIKKTCNGILTKCGPLAQLFGVGPRFLRPANRVVKRLKTLDAEHPLDQIHTVLNTGRVATLETIIKNAEEAFTQAKEARAAAIATGQTPQRPTQGTDQKKPPAFLLKFCINVSFNFPQKVDIEARKAAFPQFADLFTPEELDDQL